MGTGSGSPAGAVERAGGRIARRIAGTVVVVAVAVGLTPSAAGAAPRRPGDSQIQAAQEQARAVEDRIRGLSGRLTAAQRSVDDARAESAIALDQYQATQEASEAARAHADGAAAASAQAAAELGGARGDVASFARRSYMDGSTYAGAAALISAGDPGQLVERAALLEAAGSHRSDVLQRVAELKVVADRADVVAQTALVEADALQAEAAATLEVARTAEISARAQAAALVTQQAQLQQELGAAQQELETLVGARDAAERAAAVIAAPAPAPRPAPAPVPDPPSSGGGGRPAPTPAPAPAGPGSASAAQTAIDAAMAYLGTPYAWGGGGTRGPGEGQDPDEGIVGFDCSGLTQYAYARAGIPIPRNSRAQYAALPKASSDDLRPGDLVFWGTDTNNPNSITHVALYLGGDQVVQAPQSGDVVKVSPMWWQGYVGAVRPSA
ncbi:C40 family peptidase [Blastococcus capsensis]|uniref:C40 family peptidase n=1 Tax=Blastococcus capsensis TaxID=1564163 RepID=UPI00254258A0|nr:C40 family peptidase [Blastococcus capsensis]MDK3257520.1 C40 family peptidase [Blastococcus capsensis]